MLDLEEVKYCDLCQNILYKEIFVRNDLNTFLEGNFRFVQCLNCGLVYQNPRPSKNSFSLLYQENYDQFMIVSEKGFEGLFHQYGLHKRFNLILKHKNNGKILDIGCSSGDFLKYVSNYQNWKVYGIEPSKYACNMALQSGLKNIYNMDVEEFARIYHEKTFDVITLWNVIEHLYSPSKEIRIIHDLLNPGGILIITTPDVDSFSAQLFGKYWIGYELPRHFFVFSKKTLTTLLKNSGFKILEFINIYGEHAAFMSSLRFLLRAITNKPLDLQILFSTPIRLALAPFFRLVCMLGKGSWLTVIAKKNG